MTTIHFPNLTWVQICPLDDFFQHARSPTHEGIRSAMLQGRHKYLRCQACSNLMFMLLLGLTPTNFTSNASKMAFSSWCLQNISLSTRKSVGVARHPLRQSACHGNCQYAIGVEEPDFVLLDDLYFCAYIYEVSFDSSPK